MRRKINRRKLKKQRKIIVISLICFMFIMIGGYAAFQTNLNIIAKGNIIEKSRVIQSWNGTDNTDFHSAYYKENIISATFLDNNDVPSNAIESWDVSENKDRGVMAYVVPNDEDNTKYDLYIGANGGVVANEDSSCLFYDFTGLISINFNNYFDTSLATNMRYMFYHCSSLETLDLSNFNTSNVTNMSYFVAGGNNLTRLDLSNFDTRNVIIMNHMFSSWYAKEPEVFQESKLKEIIFGDNFLTTNVTNMADMFSGLPLEILDLSNFNTENVTSMYHMFRACYNLTTLNLCSFNTKKVIDIEGMFSKAPSLTKIYVGSGWDTSNAIIDNMFDQSAISSVTTGQCI